MGSDFLYAIPSFLTGMARGLDLFGLFDEYNDSPNDDIADWLAMRADWGVVGLDLAAAMDEASDTLYDEAPAQPQR